MTLLLVTASAASAVAQASQAGTPSPASASANSPKGAKLKFDAASVRPSDRKFFLKGTDFLDPVSSQAPPPGGLFSWNVQLVSLIDFAYDLRGSQVRREAWEALPKWAQAEWYTIEARADGNPTRADVRQMVRSLLEERFQFAGHVEEREGDVFALEVIKPGLGLKPHPEGEPCTLSPSVTDEKKFPHAYPPYKGVPLHCGVFNRELSRVGERRLEMLDVTMQQLADSLSFQLPLSVLDRTRLEGHYDAVLDFGPNALPPNSDSTDEIGLPQLPAALEKQLGLKLEKQKAQVQVSSSITSATCQTTS